ncbi:hypothetical protein JCM11641_001661 [Rhodosporidiobolus odoratus]
MKGRNSPSPQPDRPPKDLIPHSLTCGCTPDQCTTCQWTALNPSTTDDGTKANAAGSDQYAQQQQRQQANSNYPPPPGRGYDVGYQTQPQGAKV